jgi:hypothetical protein
MKKNALFNVNPIYIHPNRCKNCFYDLKGSNTHGLAGFPKGYIASAARDVSGLAREPIYMLMFTGFS